ncbi:MAG: hypothetical protein ACREMK_03155 [Gemmatimonadota bacterium]
MTWRCGRAGLWLAAWLAALPASASAQSDVGFSPYLGALWFDGSCVNWEDGGCEGRFANGDPTVVAGARLSMTLRDPWGLEVTYGASPIKSGPGVPVPVDQREGSGATFTDTENVPFNVNAHLYYGALTYALRRTERTNLFLSGAIGGITFDGSASDDPAFTDLLLGLGIGGSVRLDRLISLRADLRAFSQPCREDIFRDGFRCEDGSTLGHLELSGGVVLGFPGLPEAGPRQPGEENQNR